MRRFNVSSLKQKVREAQRTAERKLREIQRKNEQRLRQRLAEIDRKVEARNRLELANFNARVRERNRRAEARSKQVVAALNRQLRSPSSAVRYSEPERRLADRVHQAVSAIDEREYDSFLSYARNDGAEVATQLRTCLEALGVAVWFDEVAIAPGRSQSLQMDAGLRKARSGIVVLTPAYLGGGFWTERELGALLRKDVLIPVLHNVTFDDVEQYSGILPDLAGFSTESDGIDDIARKIAAAVLTDA